MNNIFLTTLLFALCAEFGGTLYADIAPPIFPGYSLSPFDTKGIQMKSEKIDIYYGEPCRIDAVYEIVNPTKEIVEQKIGFPFNITATRSWGRGHHDTASKIYDFTMSLNGENLVETDVPPGREIRSDTKYWYGWTCKLKPNLNIVKLAYHVVTTSGSYRWERNLYYEFTSEKNWPEKIDYAHVTIHFPENINKEQILDGTSPGGYELKGKEINWQFSSFTPNPEGNIHLHIIDFNFYANMLKYDRVLSMPNSDNATKMEAAEFFTSLAPYKGINISAPTWFKRSYYEETVVPNLTPSEKTLFESSYKLNTGPRGDFYSPKDYRQIADNDSLQRRIVEVMKRIGYFEKVEYPVIYKYIEGAKRLFQAVVASEPKNASAWKKYLESYYLIETGCSPCIPYAGARVCDCPESQKELVREAFRYCGNDSTIAAWNNYLFHTRQPLPDTVELESYGKSQHKVTIKIKHENHGWSDKPLSADEFSLVKSAYKLSVDGSCLVLGSSKLDEDTQKKLVEILGGCALYHYKFCHELQKFRNRVK